MARVRRMVEVKVRRGGVGVEDPFEQAVKEKKGIKYEILRLIKCQNKIMNIFNALALMMCNFDRIANDDVT